MVVRTVPRSLLIPTLAGLAGLLFARSPAMSGIDITPSYVQKLTPHSTLYTSNTTPSSSLPPPPGGARSPFDQHGSWMGNTWIPPKGWSTFSALDMLELYKDKCLLWLGDSTARRGSLTMYAIINSTGSKNYNSTTTSQAQFHPIPTELDHRNVINVNRKTDPAAWHEDCNLLQQVKQYRPSIC